MRIIMSDHKNEMCDHFVPFLVDNQYVMCRKCEAASLRPTLTFVRRFKEILRITAKAWSMLL